MKSSEKTEANLSSKVAQRYSNMERWRLITELYFLGVFLIHYTTAGWYNMDERDFLPGTSFSLSKISEKNPAGEGIAEVVMILKI